MKKKVVKDTFHGCSKGKDNVIKSRQKKQTEHHQHTGRKQKQNKK
jgi:hypothetical protein